MLVHGLSNQSRTAKVRMTDLGKCITFISGGRTFRLLVKKAEKPWQADKISPDLQSDVDR